MVDLIRVVQREVRVSGMHTIFHSPFSMFLLGAHIDRSILEVRTAKTHLRGDQRGLDMQMNHVRCTCRNISGRRAYRFEADIQRAKRESAPVWYRFSLFLQRSRDDSPWEISGHLVGLSASKSIKLRYQFKWTSGAPVEVLMTDATSKFKPRCGVYMSVEMGTREACQA